MEDFKVYEITYISEDGEQNPKNSTGYEGQENFIDVSIKNELFMDDVIYDYNVKKGAAFLISILSPTIPILVLIVGIVFERGFLIGLGFLSFMMGACLCLEFLELSRKFQKGLNNYKAESVILEQIKIKKIEIGKNKNALIFYFMRDDGTLKKIMLEEFTFEYVSYLEKDKIEVDLKNKKIKISGKYLLD